MSVECTSCGHLIPAGQFRCGKCGGLAPRESLEDFGGLTEVVGDSHPAGPAEGSAPPLELATQVPTPSEEENPHEAAFAVPRPAVVGAVSPGPAELEVQRRVPDAEGAPPRHAEAEGTHAKSRDAEGAQARLVEQEGIHTKPAEADGAHAKDFSVPKGTFASEVPQAVPAAAKTADASGELKTVTSEAPEPPAVPLSASTSAQRLKEPRAAQRPPFLASEILREDLAPLEPGKRALTLATQFSGAAGLVGTLLVGYKSPLGLACAAICIAIVVLGRLRMEYTTRAAAVALLSGTALTATVLGRLSLGASPDDPMLAAACALLPGALLFRAWYRAAQAARVMVSASLVFAIAWAAMTSHRGLLTLGFTWQSWLPALAWYLFCILCLLSLLAFMGDETTGGCGVWGLGLSVWFALFASLRASMEAQTFSESTRDAAAALGLAEAAFAAPLATTLAQLYARAMPSRRRAAIARG
jgi:hypothetical protein